MRMFVAVVVIIYLVGVGVALAPTIRDNWSTATASELAGGMMRELPRAVSWPATIYRSMAYHGMAEAPRD